MKKQREKIDRRNTGFRPGKLGIVTRIVILLRYSLFTWPKTGIPTVNFVSLVFSSKRHLTNYIELLHHQDHKP